MIALLLLPFGLMVKTWHTQTIDFVGEDSDSPSLALDLSGNPHISYTDHKQHTENVTLKYAVWTGSNWGIQYIDSGTIMYQSLALDSRDHPHICYTDYESKQVKYASWTGRNWSIEVVTSIGVGVTSNGYSDLALDSTDNPHISYFDNRQNSALKYASWTGFNWTIETVGNEYGRQCSLAIDSKGQPKICYLNSNKAWDLKLAEHTDEGWQISTICSNVSAYKPTLVLDLNDNCHICFIGEDSNTVEYAYWTGSEWSIQKIEPNAWGPSLALDSNGKPHVSYTSKYMKYSVGESSNWNIQTVDQNRSLSGPSLVIDASGEPHIACRQSFYYGRSEISDEEIFTYAIAYTTLLSAVEIQSSLYLVLCLDILALLLASILFFKSLKLKSRQVISSI